VAAVRPEEAVVTPSRHLSRPHLHGGSPSATAVLDAPIGSDAVAAASTTAPAGPVEDAYVLRLCLDLELDALLLTLAAAAAAARPAPRLITAGADTSPSDAAPDPPWQRWLHEDVELAQALATELLALDGGLPTSLASARTCATEVDLIDRLTAYHDEIRCLLSELDEAGATNRHGRAEVRAEQVAAALRHCRRRLTELELLRLDACAMQASTGIPTIPSGLPGEFLG
jgi:hypothetical protein